MPQWNILYPYSRWLTPHRVWRAIYIYPIITLQCSCKDYLYHCLKPIALPETTSFYLLILPFLLGLSVMAKFATRIIFAKYPVSIFTFWNSVSFPICIFRFQTWSFILNSNQFFKYAIGNNNWKKGDNTKAMFSRHFW